jgi:SAM-dependent methyltransferase
MNSRRLHWEAVHEARSDTEVSWFQPRPETSLELIHVLGLGSEARVIDVGGGTSRLVDHLWARGFRRLTVLDISGRALASTRARLGRAADELDWVEADVTQVALDGRYDLWHDRAVFHFLTEPADRARYLTLLTRALVPGGHAIVATFAEDGPTRCSGLPVVRYSPESLGQTLGARFSLRHTRTELHLTPQAREQSFVYCVFERTADAEHG